jgi:hypothetical protein
MKVEEVKERGYEMGEELDGDDLGAELAGEEGGQFTIEDEDDQSDEEEGQVDEGANAFKEVAGNPPPKTNGIETGTTGEPIQDPLQSTTGDSTNSRMNDEEKEDESIPCLIDRLFSCTIDLLFCAGFTVPESVKGQSMDGDKINVSPTQGAREVPC